MGEGRVEQPPNHRAINRSIPVPQQVKSPEVLENEKGNDDFNTVAHKNMEFSFVLVPFNVL